jgi:hypothetical protein
MGHVETCAVKTSDHHVAHRGYVPPQRGRVVVSGHNMDLPALDALSVVTVLRRFPAEVTQYPKLILFLNDRVDLVDHVRVVLLNRRKSSMWLVNQDSLVG